MRQLKVTQSITSRDSLSLEKYLAELARIELLTADEEIELAAQIKSGNQAALHRLTKANLRFVVSVAKQYQHRGFPLIDLINEGNIGLIRAAKNFDETKGFKFISYAVWWIRQSILQAVNDKARMVRLPSNRATLLMKLNRSSSQLTQSLGREPDTSEIASDLELDEKDLDVLQSGLFHLSLDAPLLDENGSDTLADQLPAADHHAADRGINRKSLQIELERCLSTLPKVQRRILCLFFGIGCAEAMSLQSIAAAMDLSEERVRQIKHKALGQMRSGKKRVLLEDHIL